MESLNYILFAGFWLLIVYALNCLIAGELKKIDLKMAVLYFTTVGMIGVFGEVFLDTAYNAVAGIPLWYYNVLPIQGGYTSAFAPIVWGIYGFHLYLLHGTLGSKWSIGRTRHLALIISIEALILEAWLTLSAYLFFGKLMYYYTPGDLWHVTSVQNIPFYFICAVIILKTIKRFRHSPVFFSCLSAALTFVLVFLAS